MSPILYGYKNDIKGCSTNVYELICSSLVEEHNKMVNIFSQLLNQSEFQI